MAKLRKKLVTSAHSASRWASVLCTKMVITTTEPVSVPKSGASQPAPFAKSVGGMKIEGPAVDGKPVSGIAVRTIPVVQGESFFTTSDGSHGFCACICSSRHSEL
jgi:hypothetical protein